MNPSRRGAYRDQGLRRGRPAQAAFKSRSRPAADGHTNGRHGQVDRSDASCLVSRRYSSRPAACLATNRLGPPRACIRPRQAIMLADPGCSSSTTALDSGVADFSYHPAANVRPVSAARSDLCCCQPGAGWRVLILSAGRVIARPRTHSCTTGACHHVIRGPAICAGAQLRHPTRQIGRCLVRRSGGHQEHRDQTAAPSGI